MMDFIGWREVRTALIVVFALVALAAGPTEVRAQNPSQTSRAYVPAPRALAMGDAGVALPHQDAVFFYNPAHLMRVAKTRAQFTVIGIRGGLSSNLFDQIAFFEDDLQPAIAEGIDTTNTGQVRELYNDALALGRRQTTVNGDVLLPSAIVRVGEVGLGAGIFARSRLRYHLEDAGAGIPLLDFALMGDLVFVGSAALGLDRVGIDGLAAGLSGKVTRRWLTVKSKPLDAFGENEHLPLFKAASISFDFGLLYDAAFLPVPGDVTLGFAAYDLVGSNFEYAYETSMISEREPDAEVVAEEVESVNHLFGVSPTFRLGAGYMLPGPLSNTAVTLDYLWYSTPRVPQAIPAHLHIGAQAQFGMARIRAGLNAGYTTLGGGLDLGVLELDYAFYGLEQGRFPGQLPSWHHSAQIAVRL